MIQQPFIFCDNLIKIYKVADLEIVALQGLDLAVQAGELMAVVGASGSGKSTLMNILGGLDRPTAGRVWVAGHDLLEMPDGALSRYRQAQVGFVWQQGARNLIPYLNAQDNVEWPMTLAGAAGREKRAWAEHLLDAVGLAERRRHKLSELSGGEQQRVAIAVALANKPDLLLADEPTGEVDSQTAQQIFHTFRRLNESLNLTTIIVSHDPNIAQQVDRVVAIRDGRLASETLRQAQSGADGSDPAAAFEELTVLDAAGRLQLPKTYVEQLGLRGRVRLELTEQGVLVRPVAHAGPAHGSPGPRQEAASPAPRRGWRFLRRWRRGSDEEES